MKPSHYVASAVPEGISGEWSIIKVVQPERQTKRRDKRPKPFRYRAGTYTCLQRGGTQFMSDLYDEWWTQREAVQQAIRRGGDILITGLGLGLVVEAIFRSASDKINSVTIVEYSPDVIALVADHLLKQFDGRVRIVNADAFHWRPRKKYTVAWHDIWPDPYGDVVDEEMKRLEKRYSRWCDWQGFWPRTYLEDIALS